ncbi:hypothetical protein CHUAL_009722 [Chamberlinius hualienensis]
MYVVPVVKKRTLGVNAMQISKVNDDVNLWHKQLGQKQVIESLHVRFDESRNYKIAVDNVLDPVDLNFDLETDSEDEDAVVIPREITYNRVRKKRKISDRKDNQDHQLNQMNMSNLHYFAVDKPVEPVAAYEPKEGKSTEA